MCMAVYISSDIELPIITWDEKNPSFFAEKESTDHTNKFFSKPHSYYLGAFEGCSCGFEYIDCFVEKDDPEEIKENELKKECMQKLVQYLKDALKKTRELELLICWEDEEKDPPTKRGTVTLDELDEPYWVFETIEGFYKLVKNKRTSS